MVCLVYSVILTRGVAGCDSDKDIADMTLINEHGYASQELVNTMVTGKAASNCHDGDKDVGDDFIIKGIDRQGEVGYLTFFEHFGQLEVG